jgi:hypothetical protein
MMHRANVRIIEIARVSVSSVDECSSGWIQTIAVQQNGASTVSAECERKTPDSLAPRQRCPDSYHPKKIEDKRLHPVHDRARGVLQPKTCCPVGENGRRFFTCSMC